MRLKTALSSCLLSCLLAASASADEGAVEYRQHTLSAIGGHLQAIGDILRQKVPYTAHVPAHANAIADLAEVAETLFVEGSEGGDALPEIWSDPEGFQEKLSAFKSNAAAFKTTVATGGEIGPAFQALAQSCKGCHDNYRAE
jgi:cytochrome c556